MDDELDALALSDSDLEEPAVRIGADQHHEITKIEHTDRVPVNVQHVLISDPVLSGTLSNHGIHAIKLP